MSEKRPNLVEDFLKEWSVGSAFIVIGLLIMLFVFNYKFKRSAPSVHCEDAIIKIYQDHNDGKIDILARDELILEAVKYLDPSKNEE